MVALLLSFIPIFYLLWRFLSQKAFVISHRDTFTMGYIWYGSLPLFLASLRGGLGPLFGTWRMMANLAGHETMNTAWLWSNAVWISYMLGALIAMRLIPAPENDNFGRMSGSQRASWILIIYAIATSLFFFGTFWAISNRSSLFQGYAQRYDDASRGPLQAAMIICTYIFLIAFSLRHNLGKFPPIASAATLTFLSILSLSVGTRQGLIIVFIMILCHFSISMNGLKRKTLALCAVSVIVIFSLIAIWRLGNSDLRYALVTPALESAYGFLSASTYFAFNDTALFEIPRNLLSGFANLVPRFIWPEKVEFMNASIDSYKIFSPLGGFHAFVSLLINFGWIGSLLFLACLGGSMEYVSRRSGSNLLMMTSYSLFCGVMLADIWRNPFQISIVKNIFQFGIVFPSLLSLVVVGLALAHRSVAIPEGEADIQAT